MTLAAEHVYLIPVLSLHVLLEFLVCHGSAGVLHTQSDGSQRMKPTRFVCKYVSVLNLMPVMAVVGAGEVLAVACHI